VQKNKLGKVLFCEIEENSGCAVMKRLTCIKKQQSVFNNGHHEYHASTSSSELLSVLLADANVSTFLPSHLLKLPTAFITRKRRYEIQTRKVFAQSAEQHFL